MVRTPSLVRFAADSEIAPDRVAGSDTPSHDHFAVPFLGQAVTFGVEFGVFGPFHDRGGQDDLVGDIQAAARFAAQQDRFLLAADPSRSRVLLMSGFAGNSMLNWPMGDRTVSQASWAEAREHVNASITAETRAKVRNMATSCDGTLTAWVRPGVGISRAD